MSLDIPNNFSKLKGIISKPSELQSGFNFDYLAPCPIEEYVHEKAYMYDIVTDLFSAISYTDDLSKVLKKYFSLIKVGGSLVYYSSHPDENRYKKKAWHEIGPRTMIIKNGTWIPLHSFLDEIHGLEVKLTKQEIDAGQNIRTYVTVTKKEKGFKYGNPDHDLPQDFDKNRRQYFEKLGIEKSSRRFIKDLQKSLRASLKMLNNNLSTNDKVKILSKKGGWISVSPFEAQPESENIGSIKKSVVSKWPMTSLLDMLKETELRVNFSKCFQTVGVTEKMSPETLRRRLMLTLFGLGTNMGLKRVCTTTTGENQQDLAYIKRKFVSRDNLRNAISEVANEILKIRSEAIWGTGTTAQG